jgi:hypothetical protein
MPLANPGPIPDVSNLVTRWSADYANGVRDRLVNNFLVDSERNSAFPSPVEGMVCVVDGARQFYNGSDWVPLTANVDSHSYTGGDVAFSSTSYADVGTAGDLVIPAVADDVLLISVAGQWENQAFRGDLAVRSVTRAADDVGPVGNFGLPGLSGPASVTMPVSGSYLYTVVSGDLSATGGWSAAITLRLRAKVSSASSKTISADADAPLVWHVRNLGR